VQKVDLTIAVSKFAHEELKRCCGINSEVVYDLVDSARFHPKVDGKSKENA